MRQATGREADDVTRGILFVLLGMACISVNDAIIKSLSGAYPLHQMVFIRSAIGIVASIALVQWEGGWRILRTRRPGMHLLRGLAIVLANMAFFAGLAVMPLAEATALFFVAPLFITLLSIPLLGERVGARRLAAVTVGFVGVLVMLRPWEAGADGARWLRLLPVAAAFLYACTQILTRRLGIESKASAMAIYIQATFIVVSLGFWAVAGDGRYAALSEHESLRFLLRAWVWPALQDWPLLVVIGVASAVVAYALSQAYRSADVAAIAPFEYVALPLSLLWGLLFFAELPQPQSMAGIVLIAGAGIAVFLRERARGRPVSARRPTRRW